MRALPCLILLVAACGGHDPAPAEPAPAKASSPELDALTAELKAARGPEAKAALHARLGHVYWARSCASPIDGLCVEAVAPPGQRCRAGEVLRGQARATDDVAAAREHFRAATRDATGAAVEPVALARLALADARLEEMIALGVPTGLDFSEAHARASTQKFQAWLQDVVSRGGEARQAYDQLLFDQATPPVVKIAAAARIGQINGWLADQLHGFEVPRDLAAQGAEIAQVFCEAMVERAEPLDAKAIEAFTICRDKAAEVGVIGTWPALCERELRARAP